MEWVVSDAIVAASAPEGEGEPMGKWTPDSILGLARGFQEPSILLAAAEVGLISHMAGGPATAEECAAALGLDVRAARIVLDALAAMEILTKSGSTYCMHEDAREQLSPDSPTTVLPMVLHACALWRRWSSLPAILRGRAADQVADEVRQPKDQAAFIGAMHVISVPRAPALVAAIGGHPRRLIDVGGGSGTYTIAFLRANPEMKATLFDLPPVVEMARKRFADEGLSDRVTLVAGDFASDRLPQGHDLALVSAIIHQNSPAENQRLYENVFQALVPGGRVVVRDHILSPSRTEPRAGAIFAVNMLAGTAGGDCYTFAEIREGLEAAGFGGVHQMEADTRMNGLIEARRPQ